MEKSVWESHVSLCLQKKKERARKKKEAKEAKARNAKEEAAAKEAKEAKEAKDAKEAKEAKEATEAKEVKEAKEAKEAKENAGEMEKDGDTQIEDPASSALQGEGEVPDESAVAPTEGIKKLAKKGVVKANGETPKKGKKRKADAEGGEKEPKKKKSKKDEPPKPKIAKPKGPVDVEKQCGVALENGAHCARSLTCKSHSMGAKRGVPGRSLPYDTLLQQYQKKNQAKQQSMSIAHSLSNYTLTFCPIHEFVLKITLFLLLLIPFTRRFLSQLLSPVCPQTAKPLQRVKPTKLHACNRSSNGRQRPLNRRPRHQRPRRLRRRKRRRNGGRCPLLPTPARTTRLRPRPP